MPEESLSKMWINNILYNWIFKPQDSSMSHQQRLNRLEELRKK